MTTIASFDVFDTVLIRGTPIPTNVFLLVARRLPSIGIEISPSAFLASRTAAEFRCRQNSNAEEITLEAIYRELGFTMGWNLETLALVQEIELQVETALLVPNPETVKDIENARFEGKRILFVSDMYLPTRFIRARLKQFGLMKDHDGLYVSSEVGLTKSSGRLFAHILKAEGIVGADMVHIGDHPLSDVVVPKRLGINCREYSNAKPTRYEVLIESCAVETDGLASIIAGSARFARLSGPLGPIDHAALWEAGVGVVGPILTAYVMWVLEQATQAGVQRLYFVSRDGYLLHKIAQRIAPSINSKTELRYLYGSRQAWHLPGIRRIDTEHLGWLLDPTRGMSLRHILARVDLTPENLESDLLTAGFAVEKWNQTLCHNELNRLAEMLLSPVTAEMISANAERRRKVALAYLTQEGLTDETKWAIVDLGWHGRLQTSLMSLLGDDSIVGYYFALFGHPKESGELNAYFCDADVGLGHLNSALTAPMMEIFCSVDHGMTTGYEHNGERIVPILDQQGEPLREWGIVTLHQAVLSFVDCVVRFRSSAPNQQNLRPMIVKLMQSWWCCPEPHQARLWGRFPYQDDQVSGVYEKVAAPYSWLDCLLACWRRGNWVSRSRIEWTHGSVVLTSLDKRLLVAAVGNIWKALGPLCRAVRHYLPRS